MMYSMDGYRTYSDQMVPAMYERWHDPDPNYALNDSSFYRNEMERNNCNINENIYKSNDFHEKKPKHNNNNNHNNNNIGYGVPAMSSYVLIPYFGALQQSPASPIVWHQHPESQHRIASYLSSDAMPFIPSKSGAHLIDDRSAEVLAHFSTKSAKTVATSSQRTNSHNKSPRKKHTVAVTANKWSKQNGRDEFSSNEDLATCSGGVANIANYDEDPGVVDDVNTSESESSPKIRRKHKKKSTVRQRAGKKISADGNEENKENNCLPTSPQKLDEAGAKQMFVDRFKSELNRCRAITPPLREHIKLNLPEEKLIQFLKHYLLNSNDLKVQGYPYRCESTQEAVFFKQSFGLRAPTFDVNAREFIPSHKRRSVERKLSCDSGQATGSSSSSSPSTDSDSSDNAGELKYNERTEKKCVRCTRGFHVNEFGEYMQVESCTFHWGKLERSNGYSMGGMYSCCSSPRYTKGCTTVDAHVWTGYEMGLNRALDGFVSTEDSQKYDIDYNVFALDCEMCYTEKGLEVTKVTLVSSDGQKVYEKFVRPATKIIDYNTRFSGITRKDLAAKNNTVATLPEVQRDLLNFINAETILIGHALENDLRVLKIIHGNVIDTSVCFPNEIMPGFKHSLRFLTSKYLNRTIQDSDQGHSSFEDSRACLELMLWRVRKDFRAVLEQ